MDLTCTEKYSMSLVRKIIRNVFANWFAHAVTIVVAFFLMPFIIRQLGDNDYGIWILAFSLTGHLGVLDLGLRPIIVRYVAKYSALKDDQKINEVINSTLAAFTIIGVAVLLVSIVLSLLSSRLFNVPPESYSDLRIVIILAGINLAMTFPFGVFNATIAAFQRFDLSSVIKISMYLTRSLFIVIFLSSGGGLITLGIIYVSTHLVEYLWRLKLCYRIYPELKISLTYANRKTLKMVTSFGIYGFIIALSTQIAYQSDSIVIGAFISAGAITYFAIGSNLIQYLQNIVSLLNTTLTPVASSLEAQQEFGLLKKLLIVGTRYCALIVLPIATTYIVLGQEFIRLWIGPEYAPSSSRVLTILTIAYIGYLSQFIVGAIFYGLGKVKVFAIGSIAAALANLALSLLLVKPYGIYGVAWGTTIPLALYTYGVQPIYICHLLKVKYLDYFRMSYLTPILAMIPFTLIIIAIERYIQLDSLPEFGVYIVSASLVFALISFRFAVEPDHRKAVIQKIKQATGR